MRPIYCRNKDGMTIKFEKHDSSYIAGTRYKNNKYLDEILELKHLVVKLHRVSYEHLIVGVLIGQGLSIAAFYLGLHWTVLQP